jgi:hypothetical protein
MHTRLVDPPPGPTTGFAKPIFIKFWQYDSHVTIRRLGPARSNISVVNILPLAGRLERFVDLSNELRRIWRRMRFSRIQLCILQWDINAHASTWNPYYLLPTIQIFLGLGGCGAWCRWIVLGYLWAKGENSNSSVQPNNWSSLLTIPPTTSFFSTTSQTTTFSSSGHDGCKPRGLVPIVLVPVGTQWRTNRCVDRPCRCHASCRAGSALCGLPCPFSRTDFPQCLTRRRGTSSARSSNYSARY